VTHATLTDRIARAILASESHPDLGPAANVRVVGTAAADLARAVLRLVIDDHRITEDSLRDIADWKILAEARRLSLVLAGAFGPLTDLLDSKAADRG
jgi:hypothetical protein